MNKLKISINRMTANIYRMQEDIRELESLTKYPQTALEEAGSEAAFSTEVHDSMYLHSIIDNTANMASSKALQLRRLIDRIKRQRNEGGE